jgi:hypothetical protein
VALLDDPDDDVSRFGDLGTNNSAWLRITTEYTKTAYIAAYLLRLWPPVLRPFALAVGHALADISLPILSGRYYMSA